MYKIKIFCPFATSKGFKRVKLIENVNELYS